MSDPAKRTRYVCTLTPAQIATLRELLELQGWRFSDLPYAYWRAQREKTTVVAYESGKVTVQGKGTPDLVQFVLEPRILGEARFGYEHLLAEQEKPEMFRPHIGIDESGKGDFFGPLVIAAVYVDRSSARTLLEGGVADSKTIRSAKRISSLNDLIRTETRGCFNIVSVGPSAYNRLYKTFGNVNRLLAWGHAKALENLLEKVSDCPRAISDQFGSKRDVERALQSRGRRIELIQTPKAESDIAVAAASILARDEFLRRLSSLSDATGRELPKGAGRPVDRVAAELASHGGRDALEPLAKMHFKTASKALTP